MKSGEQLSEIGPCLSQPRNLSRSVFRAKLWRKACQARTGDWPVRGRQVVCWMNCEVTPASSAPLAARTRGRVLGQWRLSSWLTVPRIDALSMGSSQRGT